MSDHRKSRREGWPQAAVQILREMWANPKLSASVIADTINAANVVMADQNILVVTRNAVIGKARRDPLCEPREAPVEFKPKKPKAAQPYQHEFNHLPMHDQMRLLGPGRCQYTEPKGWVCCGLPVMGPGKPWCAEHYAVVFPRSVPARDLDKMADAV